MYLVMLRNKHLKSKIGSTNAKIILLGIISIVCIARTSGKTDSGPHTAMKSGSVLS